MYKPTTITVFAPARLSLAGGGTDLSAFYQRHAGRVFSMSISLGVTITATLIPDDDIRILHLADMSRDLWFQPGQLPLNDPAYLAAFAVDCWAGKKGCELTVRADFPPGSGLGGSGAMCVAIYSAMKCLKHQVWSQRSAAHEASELEINKVGRPIGLQDQFQSAFGGINQLTFGRNGSVRVAPFNLAEEELEAFESCFSLFWSGRSRDSGEVLGHQRTATSNGDQATLERLRRMAVLAGEMSRAMKVRDYPGIGRLLNEAWQQKRGVAANISDEWIDRAIHSCQQVGAWGGKICGAGAGGHLLIMGPPVQRENIRSMMEEQGLVYRPFNIDIFGVRRVDLA